MELLPDETTIWAGHPTWRSMLAFHVKGIAYTAVVVLALWLVDRLGLDIGAAPIVAVAVVGIAVTILAGWIDRFFTEYAITTKRLHIRRGILAKTESSTSVDRIQNITTYQSVIDRILRVGKLDFDTASDDADDGFHFDGVNNPQQLRERIMRARDDEKTLERDDRQGGLA
ncbi:MAG: PH domain-containing protein [Solirubrobacterales bacterium]